MHPTVLLIQHLGSLQGVLQLANAQQKEKQQALLGKRVRVGDSCSSSVWYSQRLVGTVEQQGTGELCSAGCEGRINQKQSKQEHSKSQQEGAVETGGKKKRHLSDWNVPYRQTAFFQAEKLKSCIARACAFPPLLVIPLSAVMCTFENYISLESCNSDMSGTRVLMCQ